MTTTPLTERESAALAEIGRRGGALPGGRQNTQVTARLAAKGMVQRVATANAVELTPAGRAHLTALNLPIA